MASELSSKGVAYEAGRYVALDTVYWAVKSWVNHALEACLRHHINDSCIHKFISCLIKLNHELNLFNH